MQGEMKRIESGVTKMPALDETRMGLEPPRLHDQQDPAAWKASADNAAAQLEHQHHRCVTRMPCADRKQEPSVTVSFWLFRVANFRLGVKFGPAVWKAHSARTDVYAKTVEKRLRDTEAEITKVNQRRKLQQQQAGQSISRLAKAYDELVQRNGEIAVACAQLEAKIAEFLPEQENAPSVQARRALTKAGARKGWLKCW
jgi:pre-mRNA-splicing factor SPF27